VDRGFHILSIAPSGAVLGDLVELLSRLRDVHGAHLLVISDADVALKLGHSSLRLPSGVPEWLSPLVSIIPAQLYAYHLTQAKGYNTESPRSIHKVTLTH
jgi:glucosamine--fructose-6-phosphate aminotransferase (isomerizing)